MAWRITSAEQTGVADAYRVHLTDGADDVTATVECMWTDDIVHRTSYVDLATVTDVDAVSPEAAASAKRWLERELEREVFARIQEAS